MLTVEGTFADAVILETLALSIMNHDSAIATAAARMSIAAGGRPLAEMGARRSAERSAVAASRAAYIAGFGATSNLEAGRTWGVPTMGTAAHAWTLLHDSEEDAFRAQLDALGDDTTLLVDTYDIPEGVRTAVRLANERSGRLGGVRLDSGDLPIVAAEVRDLLDELGAADTRITVTSDLDEFAIAALAASPVDSYGVGTSVVTGSGYPTAGMVYKLVAREGANGEWVSVAKTAEGKGSQGGRKSAFRRILGGRCRRGDHPRRRRLRSAGRRGRRGRARPPGPARRRRGDRRGARGRLRRRRGARPSPLGSRRAPRPGAGAQQVGPRDPDVVRRGPRLTRH